jgi:hypothetical protein
VVASEAGEAFIDAEGEAVSNLTFPLFPHKQKSMRSMNFALLHVKGGYIGLQVVDGAVGVGHIADAFSGLANRVTNLGDHVGEGATTAGAAEETNPGHGLATTAVGTGISAGIASNRRSPSSN